MARLGALFSSMCEARARAAWVQTRSKPTEGNQWPLKLANFCVFRAL